jgi:hypothetical protein
MLKLTSFQLTRTAISSINGQFSENFATGNICTLSTIQNVNIKKIEVTASFTGGPTIGANIVNYFDFRAKLTNRDGIILISNAGKINNPISGVFNGSATQTGDVDLVINSFTNFVNFGDGVLAAGIIPISYSVKYSLSTLPTRPLRFLVNVFYEDLLS